MGVDFVLDAAAPCLTDTFLPYGEKLLEVTKWRGATVASLQSLSLVEFIIGDRYGEHPHWGLAVPEFRNYWKLEFSTNGYLPDNIDVKPHSNGWIEISYPCKNGGWTKRKTIDAPYEAPITVGETRVHGLTIIDRGPALYLAHEVAWVPVLLASRCTKYEAPWHIVLCKGNKVLLPDWLENPEARCHILLASESPILRLHDGDLLIEVRQGEYHYKITRKFKETAYPRITVQNLQSAR